MEKVCQRGLHLPLDLFIYFLGLFTHGDELIHARKVEQNMVAGMDKMALFLPLMVTYSKLKSQVDAKRYEPTLNVIYYILQNVFITRFISLFQHKQYLYVFICFHKSTLT